MSFEFLNYTIITSKCKGPNYPPNLCCPAFKEFACPYADALNDLTNDCASTMFSYINLYGKYPPGLFASECREGKEGLACPAPAPSVSANESGTHNMYPSPLLILTAGFFLLLFKSLWRPKVNYLFLFLYDLVKKIKFFWYIRFWALFSLQSSPAGAEALASCYFSNPPAQIELYPGVGC